MPREEHLGAQAQFLQRARTEVLHEHVRLAQEVHQPRDRPGILQVEGDPALVGVDREEAG